MTLLTAHAYCIAGPSGPASRCWRSQVPMSQIVDRSANIVAGRYAYTDDLLRLEECVDGGSPPSWPASPSPVRLANWRGYVRAHPDQRYASYIYSGLATGFRIGFNWRSTSLRPSLRNHPSAFENRDQVRDYILEEREAGHLVGPLDQSFLPRVHCSPIGLVLKSRPNQWRMIADLSYPTGHIVNDGINSELASISYG